MYISQDYILFQKEDIQNDWIKYLNKKLYKQKCRILKKYSNNFSQKKKI